MLGEALERGLIRAGTLERASAVYLHAAAVIAAAS